MVIGQADRLTHNDRIYLFLVLMTGFFFVSRYLFNNRKKDLQSFENLEGLASKT